MSRTRRGFRSTPLLRAAGGLLLAAAVAALVVVAPEDTSPLWRHLLFAMTAALLGGAALLVLLDLIRRRHAAHDGVADAAGLPSWVGSLSRWQQEELRAVLADRDRRLRRAEQSAEQAKRRSDRSMVGMWDVLDAAVSAEERVRGRFVADLHDTVVQTMIVCAYLAEDDETSREDLAGHLRQAEQQLRDIMVLTRPPELLHGTFGTAAGHLSRTLATRHDLTVDWTWPTTEHDLPEPVAITLYRFFQEGLQNVVKHAGVSEAEAGLSIDADIVAWVHDDGAGFEPAPAGQPTDGPSGHHVGLELMAERARQVGATAHVRTAPGEGTTVTLRLRLPQATQHRPVPVGEMGPTTLAALAQGRRPAD